MLKECPKCWKEKPIEEFRTNTNGTLQVRCAKCNDVIRARSVKRRYPARDDVPTSYNAYLEKYRKLHPDEDI